MPVELGQMSTANPSVLFGGRRVLAGEGNGDA